MWNRFRLWANKNEIKIITVIVCILGCYILIKGMNAFFRNQQQEKKRVTMKFKISRFLRT